MPPRPTSSATDPIPVVVADIVTEAAGVAAFRLEPRDGGELPEWTPGAHVDVVLTPDLVRQYSLCGDPADRTGYRIAVLREEHSRGGSAFLHESVRVGDELTISVPRNNFPLTDAPRYVLIAGGIGITPLLPMLGKLVADGADWRLYYGGRERARMAFADTLLATHGERVTVHPEQDCGLLPLDDILGGLAERTAVYCCGPEGLLLAVEKAGAEREIAVHVERFRPREQETSPGADIAFDVVVKGSGQTIPVGADQTIMEALEDAGFDTPFSCREGTCATCETRYVDGEVDHRDSVLSDEDRETGDSLMICVSRSRSPRLVLDI